MIEIKNLRMEEIGGWTRVIADIESDIKRSDEENTIWVAVKKENSSMLTLDPKSAELIRSENQTFVLGVFEIRCLLWIFDFFFTNYSGF